jgi:dihydroorotase
MNEGYTATSWAFPGSPRPARRSPSRATSAWRMTGAHLHIQHVTTAEGIDTIRHTSARASRVTCETAPHHWALTDDAVRSFNTNAKMNPPLREQNRLRRHHRGHQGRHGGLHRHGPRASHAHRKGPVEFADAPFGIIGLETSLARHHRPGGARPHHPRARHRAHDRLRITHLRLGAGELKEGGPADICIFDPKAEWHTLCDGKVVYSA